MKALRDKIKKLIDQQAPSTQMAAADIAAVVVSDYYISIVSRIKEQLTEEQIINHEEWEAKYRKEKLNNA